MLQTSNRKFRKKVAEISCLSEGCSLPVRMGKDAVSRYPNGAHVLLTPDLRRTPAMIGMGKVFCYVGKMSYSDNQKTRVSRLRRLFCDLSEFNGK